LQATVFLVIYALLGQLLTIERFNLDELRAGALSPERRIGLLRQAVRVMPVNEQTQLDLAGSLATREGKTSKAARVHAERAHRLVYGNAAAWALLGALESQPVMVDFDFTAATKLDPYNHPEYYFAWASAAQTPEERYERLKLGVQRIPAEHPITPEHVRGPDWYGLNPMWAKWWQQLADLETDPALKKRYRGFAAGFSNYVAKEMSQPEPPPQPADAVTH
jgi:hypothetical protein